MSSSFCSFRLTISQPYSAVYPQPGMVNSSFCFTPTGQFVVQFGCSFSLEYYTILFSTMASLMEFAQKRKIQCFEVLCSKGYLGHDLFMRVLKEAPMKLPGKALCDFTFLGSPYRFLLGFLGLPGGFPVKI